MKREREGGRKREEERSEERETEEGEKERRRLGSLLALCLLPAVVWTPCCPTDGSRRPCPFVAPCPLVPALVWTRMAALVGAGAADGMPVDGIP